GGISADFQIFQDGHKRKQPPPFRNQYEAQWNALMRLKMFDRLTFKINLPCAGRAQPEQRIHQCAFAGRVRADEPDDLTGLNRQADIMKHLYRPVKCVEISDLKQGSSPHRDKPSRQQDRGRSSWALRWQ